MIVVRLVKGFVIGACMLIPGVSGGTMAIMLDIYDELINSLSNITKRFTDNFVILIEYLIGGVVGIMLLARPMLSLLDQWEFEVMYFFIGAILASVFPLYRKVRVSRIKLKNILVALLGLAIGVGTMYLPANMFSFDVIDSPAEFAILVGVGFIIAIALILPGISGSYILLMMGLYTITLNAVNNIDLFFLSPIIIGTILGALLTTKAIAYMMRSHPQFTYMIIIGFVLGSLVQIFPGLPPQHDFAISIATFVVGFLIVIGLSLVSKKI